MISLYDLLKAANGQLFGQPAAHLFKGFTLDPDSVGDAALYVALRSGQGDIQNAIARAIQNGVSGVLCSEPPTVDTDGVTVLMARDPQKALLDWAGYMLKRLGVKVLAVGGTMGRPTTIATITQVLGRRYSVFPTHPHADGQLELVLTLPKLRPGNQFIVMDFSSTRPGEMTQLVQTFTPDVAVITHIHCDYPLAFDNCDQFIQEQAALAARDDAALTILNSDDDYSRGLRQQASTRVQTIGIDHTDADLLAAHVAIGMQHTEFSLRQQATGAAYEQQRTRLLGKHNLYGALAALLVGQHYEVPLAEGLAALAEIEPPPGQMNALRGVNGSLLIDDSHQADTASTLAALDWLQAVRSEGKRTIVVMGSTGMASVNGQRTSSANLIGQRVATCADVLITQGTDAALIAQAAQANNMRKVQAASSIKGTMQTLSLLRLGANDVVLVKGNSAAGMEQVVSALLENSADRERLPRRDFARSKPADSGVRPLQPSWVEVDPQALANNVRILRAGLTSDVTLMAVVKANAYGHGAVMAARTALMAGAGYLAVASMAEAMELRYAGITAPILILSYTPDTAVQQAIRHELTVTVFDLESATRFQRAAQITGSKLKCHVKIDTGMGRLGMLADDAIRIFRHFSVMENLAVEGVYTHFSVADEDPDYTREQVSSFKRVVRALRAGGFQFKYIHAANSAGTQLGDGFHLNMVRPGLLMYGVNSSSVRPLPTGVRPLFTWKTSVLQVKQLPPGHPVGYGNTYRTRNQETIAILPVGYADGLRRSPRTWRHVLIHGQRAPLVGRVSMEKCAVNVSYISGVANGDEVVLIGKQGDDEITLDEVAAWLDTIPYEVLVSVLPRQPRL